MDRRATTIVAADLAGYSRLMALDEDAVIGRLRDVRSRLIDPAIAGAGGRVIKTMGDGMLIEFPSPLTAVRTALDFQLAVAANEAARPEDQRLRFRVGINHGEVVIDGDDVLGDVVNIAARLESLSAPGGLCISRSVQETVGGRIGAVLTSLGPQFVKNIPVPVEVWRVEVEGVDAPSPSAIARQERASVAVLAFTNLSSDPEQDFLADGITQDVITQLSRFRSLLVIARSSTFAYKGSSKDVRQIARELGVRYVVSGSVQRAGGRLRASAQLVEGETGVQVWADRWDRDAADLFALQDDVTRTVVRGVAPELGANERSMARKKPTESLTAWELSQRGQAEFFAYTAEGYKTAFELFHAAIAADPAFALPRAYLARWHAVRIFSGRSKDVQADVGQGMQQAMAAIGLDDRLEEGYIAQAMLLTVMGREADARDALAKAMALNNNHAGAWQAQTFINLFQPKPDTAEMEAAALTALQLSPKDPLAWAFHWMVVVARWIRDREMAENVKEHLDAACRLPQVEYFPVLAGAVMYVRLGNLAEAGRLLDLAMQRQPGLTLTDHVRDFKFPSWPELKLTITAEYEKLVELGLPRE